MKKWFVIAWLLIGQACYAQSATINWGAVHQVIDGFGGMSAGYPSSQQTSAMQHFWFDNTPGNLGLTILRIPIPDGPSGYVGDCTSVGTACVSSGGYTGLAFISDAQVAYADGAKIYASSWSATPAWKTNGQLGCTAGSGNSALLPAYYGSYATWLANFALSMQSVYGIPVYAISPQNEPNFCPHYDGMLWTAANFDTFIKDNLGPTFAADGLSTLIFMPETTGYAYLSGMGATCMTDSSCAKYVGGVNWHDYDATLTYGSFLPVNATPYPSGWPSGKHYWETEAGCINGAGPNICESGWHPEMAPDGLMWAAIYDDRMAVENATGYTMFGFWQTTTSTTNAGLERCDQSSAGSCTVAQRAYVLGQYARFVRPGYHRIDATHIPQSGITVSAYSDTASKIAIVATNYMASPVTLTFNISNAPSFSSVTPYTTSATQQIQEQSAQSVAGNSFTYTLPAESVTTFVGASSATAAPAAPTNLRATVN